MRDPVKGEAESRMRSEAAIDASSVDLLVDGRVMTRDVSSRGAAGPDLSIPPPSSSIHTGRLSIRQHDASPDHGDQDADDQRAGDRTRRSGSPVSEDVADGEIPQATHDDGDQPRNADQSDQPADISERLGRAPCDDPHPELLRALHGVTALPGSSTSTVLASVVT